MGIERPLRPSRRIVQGALAGALLFAAFFAIELGRTDISFMGTSDAEAVKTIVGQYQGRIVGQQALLFALALAVGGFAGGLGGWYSILTNRARSRGGAMAFGIVAALLAHAYFGLRSLATYPALYVESMQEGRVTGPILALAARWLSPRRLDVVVAIGLLFALSRVVSWEPLRRRLRALRPGAIGFVLLLSVGALAWWIPAPRFETPKRPHVFLIAVDSLRADRVFGERAARDFPALAGLAKRAVRFHESYVTVPRTFSSFVTLLSGRYPQHHGIRHMFPRPEARAAIGPTLVTRLDEAGYRTIAVSDYAGEIFSRTPLGFDRVVAPYFDIRTIVDQRSLQGHPNLLPYATLGSLQSLFPAVAALPERADPALLTARALAEIDRQPRDASLFLTLFFSTAHFPYAAPAPFHRRFADPAYQGPFRYSKLPLVEAKSDADITQIRALYDGAIAATDAALGDFVSQLERRGLLANSVIVLLADHGEELYDVKQNGMGHGDHLEGAHANHVPLLILDGRGKLAPRDVDALVRDVDVAPTLAALLGLPKLETDGVDLGPLLDGTQRDLGLTSYSETELWLTESGPGFPATNRLAYPSVTGTTELLPDGDIVLQKKWEPMVIAAKHRVLRTPDYKLVYRPTATGARWSLYDRRADPEEQLDIAAQRPLLLPLLQQQLAGWIALDGSLARGGYFVPPEQTAPLPTAPASACRRLIDCAGRAQYEGPSVRAAIAAARFPQHFVSRWTGLGGELAYRVAAFALTIPNVARYPEARQPGATRLDPVWNRTRGVYESKSAVVAPAGSVYRFELPAAAGATLSTAVATLPGDPDCELTIEVDGMRVATFVIGARGLPSGMWHEQQVEIPKGRELVLRVRALRATKRSALALWGVPLLHEQQRPPATNVMIVLVDTLRADALAVMPNLRAFAERGTRFSQAISVATWTRPALLGLYGGDLASALGQSAEEMIPTLDARDRFYRLAPTLLPQALGQRDYLTAAIGNNFFLLGYPQIGLDLGFDQVTDIRHPQLDTPAITRAVEAFLTQQRGRPFLLHVHYDAPHWPYTPPPEHAKKLVRPAGFPDDVDSDKYLAEAAFTDEHLGILFRALASAGQLDKTLVVVLGDHGEVFDHAHDHHVKALDLPTLHHHGWSAYDEVARVPLVVVGPNVPAGKVVDAPVSIADIAPTLTALLGLPPLGKDRRGTSLLGALPASRDLFVEGQNVRLLRSAQHAYLRRGDGRLQRGKQLDLVPEELYDLVADPQQHTNLASTQPQLLAELRRRFEAGAPTVAEPPSDVVHLRFDPTDRELVFEGTIDSDRPLRVASASGVEAAPLSDHQLRVRVRAPGTLDLIVAPDAQLRLQLQRNGTPVGLAELRLGRFALPLLRGAASTVIAATQQNWLDGDAAPPPVPGQIAIWRQRASHGRGTVAGATDSGGDVATMMKKWGYAK